MGRIRIDVALSVATGTREMSAMIKKILPLLIFMLPIISGCAAKTAVHNNPPTEHQFTFSWEFSDADAMKPRGGVTTGAPVILDKSTNPGWVSMQEPGLTKYERDRKSILSMAGTFRVTFNFIETIPLRKDYKVTRPYQSWATEYIKVIEDKGNFISLQHILVMYFIDENGKVEGPAVTKHWRQDWKYEDEEILEYKGNNTWQTVKVPKNEAAGKWSQAVYQVDDTPRYEALGEWKYDGNYFTWTSPVTWRPLPRREFSVRDDYNVLSGVNRVTITPNGWVHEQDNLKLIVDKDGREQGKDPYLAKEIGLDRYERITDFNDSPAIEYWEHTAPFWADVRQAWQEAITANPTLRLKSSYQDKKLYEYLFEFSDKFAQGGEYDKTRGKEFAETMINDFVIKSGTPPDKAVY
ncbi:MAG: DUF6607 family protein [Thermodesulfobacteriota bacterium]